LGGPAHKLSRVVRYSPVAGSWFCYGSAGSSYLSLRLPAKTKPPATGRCRYHPCRKEKTRKDDEVTKQGVITSLYIKMLTAIPTRKANANYLSIKR